MEYFCSLSPNLKLWLTTLRILLVSKLWEKPKVTQYTQWYIALSPAAMIYANKRHVGGPHSVLILSPGTERKNLLLVHCLSRNIEAAQLNDSSGGREKEEKNSPFHLNRW